MQMTNFRAKSINNFNASVTRSFEPVKQFTMAKDLNKGDAADSALNIHDTCVASAAFAVSQ